MNTYEINEDTIAVIPIDYEKTKVLELNNEYIIEKKAYKIMDDSCKYYGSNYKGRLSAAKEILNCSYKIPILVEESKKLIFFPTKSSLEEDCCWINFDLVNSVIKNNESCILECKNNKKIEIKSSKLSIDNQIARSTRLSYIINQRINSTKNDIKR